MVYNQDLGNILTLTQFNKLTNIQKESYQQTIKSPQSDALVKDIRFFRLPDIQNEPVQSQQVDIVGYNFVPK